MVDIASHWSLSQPAAQVAAIRDEGMTLHRKQASDAKLEQVQVAERSQGKAVDHDRPSPSPCQACRDRGHHG